MVFPLRYVLHFPSSQMELVIPAKTSRKHPPQSTRTLRIHRWNLLSSRWSAIRHDKTTMPWNIERKLEKKDEIFWIPLSFSLLNLFLLCLESCSRPSPVVVLIYIYISVNKIFKDLLFCILFWSWFVIGTHHQQTELEGWATFSYFSYNASYKEVRNVYGSVIDPPWEIVEVPAKM